METENTTLPYLHHELIIQILVRLPVKSVIRFKCVCKSWISLISDPNFANSHFELTATSHTRRILSISSHSPHEFRSIDFESSSLNHHWASLNLNFSLPQSYFPPDIRGSCRGFIFLHCSSNICIWNPSTGFHKQIPLSPFDTKLKEYHFDHLYGFGYDRSRDDYLVVSLSYDPTIDDISPNFEFFSVRDNTWKQIGMEDTQIPYMISANDHRKIGVLFNEAIYWLAFRYDLKVFVIVTFDLMERKLLGMPPLPDDFIHQTTYCGLWVFGEFLSLWAMKGRNIFQMWVMKDSKLHSSWTKTLDLRIDDIIPNFSPICSTKSGDIIGRDGDSGLVKYNNDKVQLLDYHSYYNNSVGSKVAMYTESLLSLPGDHKQVQKDDTNKKNKVLKYSPSPFYLYL